MDPNDSREIEDPLDTLFVKDDEVNREILRDALIKFVRVDENGRIYPLAPFYKQSNRNKVILLLLARKAIALRTNIVEAVSPLELGKLSSMPDGSLRPTLRTLVNEGLIDDENSEYKVLPHAVARCADILSKPTSDPENDVLEKTIIKNHKNNTTQKISMRDCVVDLVRQGGLDSPKSVREIFEVVLRRRPNTDYNSLYKVILDLVNSQQLIRENKDGVWHYRRKNG